MVFIGILGTQLTERTTPTSPSRAEPPHCLSPEMFGIQSLCCVTFIYSVERAAERSAHLLVHSPQGWSWGPGIPSGSLTRPAGPRALFCRLPRHMNKRLDQKQSCQDSKCCSKMNWPSKVAASFAVSQSCSLPNKSLRNSCYTPGRGLGTWVSSANKGQKFLMGPTRDGFVAE